MEDLTVLEVAVRDVRDAPDGAAVAQRGLSAWPPL